MNTSTSNFVKIATGVCLMLCLPLACRKDFLEKQPYGVLTENILCDNLSGADQLLIAAYGALDGFSGWDNGSPWGSAASNWLFGSVAGGDAYKGSEPYDQPPIEDLEIHTVKPNNSFVEAKWRQLYDAISRCNEAIRCLQHLSGTDPLVATRLGEARLLRGHYHFEAKKIWNKVPYIDEKITDYRVPNDRDIWPDIEADLQAAADALPWSQPEIGRVTKGAALSLLGKAYLFQQKYAAAQAALTQVIESGRYQLLPAYQDNFNIETRHNKEAVFVVQQSVNDGAMGENGNLGDLLNYPYNGGPGACCGFHQPSQNLVNAFRVDAQGLPLLDTYNDVDVKNDAGVPATSPFDPEKAPLDPRLDWTVGRRGIPYLDWGIHPGETWIRNQQYAGPYSPKKNAYYRKQEGTFTEKNSWAKGYSAQTIKLIRYSDVLLMAAECELELDNLDRARAYINQLRRRAANTDGWVKDSSGVPAANYLVSEYSSFPDKTYARKALRHERRLELGMEGHRFFDLVRWGIAAEEKQRYFEAEGKKRLFLSTAQFVKNKNEYFPIPQRAIDLSWKNGSPSLQQNPGY